MAERRAPRRRVALTLGLGATLALGPTMLGIRAAVAAFVDDSVTAAAAVTAAPDWTAPEVASTTVGKTEGYLAGSIRQGGSYYVYANVTDTGNPASGIPAAGETADVSALTPAGAAVTLVAGTYSAEGVTYNYRSAPRTATTPLAAGGYSYAIASTDVAGNTRTQTGYAVTVDNTRPAAADVQTTNAGTAGRAEAGDTIVFTYSERIDPQSILAGWVGAATAVTVRLIDGGCVLNLLLKVCSDDSVTVWNAANSSQLPLGTIDLNDDDYHGTALGTASPITFASTMVQSGPTITITLGSASGSVETASGSTTMAWSPSASAYDAAGNAASTATDTESGGSDREF